MAKPVPEGLGTVTAHLCVSRWGQLQDPFGHVWSIATHKEDLTPQQMEERQKAFFATAKAK